jgi:hypothetical protein
MTRRNRDDWLDDDEFPDDRDIDDFGDDSPGDYDSLTVGLVPTIRPPFWTRKRIFVALLLLLLALGLILTRFLLYLSR